SRFVAEFVGDNNLFDGEVSATQPPRARVDDHEIRLPETSDVSTGESVTLCVRPEKIRLGEGETTLTATVENSEFLGDAYRLHCTWNGRSLLVKTDARQPPGDTIELGFDAADIHLLSGE
ncbi:MAG: ABC transporter ATP-binding protein, partial [Halobacteriales archaeon SW_9_67_24]